MNLAPHLEVALAAIEQAFSNGARRVLCALPPGTGEDELALEYARRTGRCWIVANGRERWETWPTANVRWRWPEVLWGIVGGRHFLPDLPGVVYASTRKVVQMHREGEFWRWSESRWIPPIAAVIFHDMHVETPGLLEALRLFRQKPILGLTSSVALRDGKPPKDWETVAYRLDIRDAISMGIVPGRTNTLQFRRPTWIEVTPSVYAVQLDGGDRGVIVWRRGAWVGENFSLFGRQERLFKAKTLLAAKAAMLDHNGTSLLRDEEKENRKKPATPALIESLLVMGYKPPDRITRGEAQDLVTAAEVREAYG